MAHPHFRHETIAFIRRLLHAAEHGDVVIGNQTTHTIEFHGRIPPENEYEIDNDAEILRRSKDYLATVLGGVSLAHNLTEAEVAERMALYWGERMKKAEGR